MLRCLRENSSHPWLFAITIAALALVRTPCALAAEGGLAKTASTALPAEAPLPGATAEPRLRGSLPPKLKAVTVRVKEGTAAQALAQICQQLKWGLVLPSAEAAAGPKLEFQMEQMPARDVLELVLEQGGFEAELRAQILVVTASKPAPSAAQPGRDQTTDPKGADNLSRSNKLGGDAGAQEEDDDEKHRGRYDRHGRGGQNDLVRVGSSITVGPGEVVSGDAVAIGGSIRVERGAVVKGDAVAINGSMTLASGAVINGDAVTIGGSVEAEPGAIIKGDRVSLGLPGTGLLAGLGVAAGFLGTLFYVIQSVVLFIVVLLVTAVMPVRLERAREYLGRRTGFSVLAGFALLIGSIPLLLILAVTIIGIPLIPVVAVFLLALLGVGLATLLTWIGFKIPLFKSRKGPLLALLLGFLVFVGINCIPIFGTLLCVLGTIAAAGAVLLSRFGSSRSAAADEK